VANAGETDHELFSGGSFTGADFVSAAADARDAGTEVNDEDPTNTAFFGQMDPDTGTVEGANITVHPGYTPGGAILMDAMFTGADFANTPGYEFLRFSLSSSTPTLDPTGIASIRVSGNTATLTASAMNLSGDVTAVLLRDAAAGATGAIIEDLTTDIDTNADGSFGIVEGFSIDDAFRTALEAGTVYIELQTELNPDGELRGQITPPIEAL
jgi:hypothetical protein